MRLGAGVSLQTRIEEVVIQLVGWIAAIIRAEISIMSMRVPDVVERHCAAHRLGPAARMRPATRAERILASRRRRLKQRVVEEESPSMCVKAFIAKFAEPAAKILVFALERH